MDHLSLSRHVFLDMAQQVPAVCLVASDAARTPSDFDDGKDNFHLYLYLFILLPVDVPQAAEHEDEVGGAVLLLVLD